MADQSIIDKIRSLPPEKLAEVEDFVDLVLVPFPFTDQTGIKKRPAFVVSSDAYPCQRPDVG